jgi:hypothetical protein
MPPKPSVYCRKPFLLARTLAPVVLGLPICVRLKIFPNAARIWNETPSLIGNVRLKFIFERRRSLARSIAVCQGIPPAANSFAKYS